ncbi:MAG: hypothetical protein D3908_01870 [Candidatus Electrothrix sp. AUS4]|nr:hypothetical protein [Candidatus Electrothrix sp. AUS4]
MLLAAVVYEIRDRIENFQVLIKKRELQVPVVSVLERCIVPFFVFNDMILYGLFFSLQLLKHGFGKLSPLKNSEIYMGPLFFY